MGSDFPHALRNKVHLVTSRVESNLCCNVEVHQKHNFINNNKELNLRKTARERKLCTSLVNPILTKEREEKQESITGRAQGRNRFT